MKTTLSLLLTILTLSVFAQGKWQYGISFSPAYSYRKLTSYNKGLEERRNKEDKPMFGFSTGLNATRALNSKWALQLGLQYQKRAYKYHVDESGAVFYLESDRGPFIGHLKSITNMVQVPISVLYTLGNKKVRPFFRVGLQPGVWLNKSYNNYALDFDLASAVGAGVRYAVSTSSEFRVEPCFTYGLVPFNDGDFNEKLWTLGLNLSYYKTF